MNRLTENVIQSAIASVSIQVNHSSEKFGSIFEIGHLQLLPQSFSFYLRTWISQLLSSSNVNIIFWNLIYTIILYQCPKCFWIYWKIAELTFLRKMFFRVEKELNMLDKIKILWRILCIYKLSCLRHKEMLSKEVQFFFDMVQNRVFIFFKETVCENYVLKYILEKLTSFENKTFWRN